MYETEILIPMEMVIHIHVHTKYIIHKVILVTFMVSNDSFHNQTFKCSRVICF